MLRNDYNNDVKRFHKGAFYLAEQFSLDILPLYIHGNSEVLPKGDFIIYDGNIIVKIGDRISKNDLSFGTTYKERAKNINAYFRNEFSKLRNEIEDENYFKKKLFLSFLYKETEVVKEVKQDFKENRSVYFELNKHIAKDANVLHIADDFGQKDILLTLQQAGRRVFSLIQNEEKRQIAANNYIVKTRKLNYLKNISEVTKDIDVLLISDSNFNLNEITNLPKTIIFVNTENTVFDDPSFNLVLTSESIKVFRSEK